MYALRINEMSRSYLTLAEAYKTTAFLERNLLVREIVEKISPFIEGIGAIFGSYAKGTANKESDLDVFIAGSCNKEEIKKVSRKYGLEISVKCYPMETFKKNIAADLLLREILKNHLIFLNAGQFVRAALENG
ncbi:MAG: nucleotidyltransferase domain-containing protein [Candidatus Woesearchaeota archaeon]|nr:nucleotidyltransferase domain-containing protein [Candidatus Woesearchaeota archaeon]